MSPSDRATSSETELSRKGARYGWQKVGHGPDTDTPFLDALIGAAARQLGAHDQVRAAKAAARLLWPVDPDPETFVPIYERARETARAGRDQGLRPEEAVERFFQDLMEPRAPRRSRAAS